MLTDVIRQLRCPLCAGSLNPTRAALTCPHGHCFDISRQGYVSLLTGRAPAGADTTDMVAARARLLAAGHFDFLATAVADTAATASSSWPKPPGLIVDIGAGTGHYLAAVLARLPDHHGLALDVAKAAVRQAVRVHPRASAAVADAWRGLPLTEGCADLLLNIFAPRNGAEFRRVLRPTGTLLVVTPRPEHLNELVRELDLLTVDPDKDRRLDATLGPWFTLETETPYVARLRLTRSEAINLVAMGPSAWHTGRTDLADQLPSSVEVHAAVTLRRYRPR